MKKENFTLSKKLKQYSALAGSMLTIAGFANAQVIYTDVDPDFEFDAVNPFPGDQLALDLNNDGTTDFNFYAFKGSTYQVIGCAMAYTTTNTNAIIGTLSSIQGKPLLLDNALSLFDPIDGNQPFYQLTDLIFSTSHFFIPVMASSSTGNPGGTGAWIGQEDKYLGLRFTDGVNTYYGWARCSVSADATAMILKDYAYNSTPNHGLYAGGSFGTGISSQAASADFSIFGYEGVANIFVTNGDLNDASVTIINMLGETIVKQALTDRNTRIDLNQFAKGIYLVSVQRGNEVFSKKISFR